MTTQKPLATAFDARKSFTAHRASTIYPLRIREQGDLHIVFLNYWLLKNDIAHVGVNFRVYDAQGGLRARQSLEQVNLHNQISVRDALFIPNGIALPFDGMVEVEVVSNANLAFPFPAIMGIYESHGFFSAVHAAGRIKNADELKKPQRSQETNWNCKFERDAQGFSVVPFFHYFVGATPLPVGELLEVSMRDAFGKILETVTVPIDKMTPFASRIFFADEIFSLDKMPAEGAFLSVKLLAYDVFPRLVVGNFHRRIDFLEVTHSFPITEFTDYCPVPENIKNGQGFPSLLAAQTARGLDLAVRVFPTNCPGIAKATVNSKRYESERLQTSETTFDLKSDLDTDGLSFSLSGDEEMRVIHLQGSSIPSRLNASYAYRVAGAPQRFSTDIATGAKSIVYPPKWRHWGHGCIGGGYDSYLLFRNNTHTPAATTSNSGEIRFIAAQIDRVVKIAVGAESCVALRLSDVLEIDPNAGNPTFISWILSMSQPVGETFWVAFRPDGAVFGEHGF